MIAAAQGSSVSTFRDAMQSHGYQVTGAPLARSYPAVEDAFLAIQFGNEKTVGADGVPTLQIDATLRLNGRKSRDQAKRWFVVKTFLASPVHRRVHLQIKIDLVIAGLPASDLFLEYERANYAHVRELIADARETLCDLPLARSPRAGEFRTAPVVHIESITIGDLVTGRSGLLKNAPPEFLAAEVALRIDACDGLAHEVLPDLIRTAHVFMDDLSIASTASHDTSLMPAMRSHAGAS